MNDIEFALRGEYIALNQLLKLTGLCDSGGQAKHIIANAGVTVDGQVETRKTCKIRAGQIVQLSDARIRISVP